MAEALVWDRLLQEQTAEVVTPVQPGRYRLVDGDESLRPVPILDGTAELPDRRVEAWQAVDCEALELNSRAVAMLAEDDRASKLRPVLALGLQPAEEDDEAILGFLDAHQAFQRVMNDPAELLERRDELTAIGHGGRITPRTMRRLASHADDWRTRRGRFVEPRRLLVERLHPQLDRPENRLVINTLVLLKRRLDLLAEDARGQSNLNDNDLLQRLNFRAQHRSTLLWSHTGTSDEDIDTALRNRRADLESALTSVANLSSSLLGRALAPWRERSAEGAFGSNLLRDHESYSKIGRLWRLLTSNADLDLSARRAMAVAREERFDDYAMTCLHHAIENWPGAQRDLDGLVAVPRLRRSPDGTIEVTTTTARGDERAVRVVPQFVGLDDLQVVRRARASDSDPVIVVGAAEPNETNLLRLGNDGSPTIVGIGPYVLTGVEALGSSLRWHLEAEELLSYPRRLRLPGPLATATAQLGQSGLIVRREPANDIAIVSVENDTDLAAQAHTLLPFAARNDQLGPAVEELRNAVRWTRLLMRCPTCRARAKAFDTDGDRFMAQCSQDACGAHWGIDLCPVGHRRPLLRFPNSDKHHGMDRWAQLGEDPCPRCLSAPSGKVTTPAGFGHRRAQQR